ncbi:HpcH/HpaI aldolase family protein [Paraburkholderia sp. BCC1884]|uniref:HpcH/HpaI aldolase family protein n=1 Tax=Paraburkholderia sp. BCC1884 TaxID=2562668 RepID=UPI0021B3910A|nr:aldolase/citrate lyase family protein [Paraburkholderia sp. BCC1884]
MTAAQMPIDTRLPDMLRSGRRLRGVFNSLSSPAIVEMCAYAGFDFVIIDNEHGSSDFGVTEHMLRAARASGIVPVIRCFEHDLPRFLDMGASAVQVPMVETAAQACRLVDSVRYPPIGRRGCAFSPRAAGYGAFTSGHTQRSDEGIALIAMIETPTAIANAREIAEVDGVDAVFVGPNDLAHAMGHGSKWNAPEVHAAIVEALSAITAAGKCAGIVALSADDEDRYAALGARYFANVTTSLITRAFAEAARGQSQSIRY